MTIPDPTYATVEDIQANTALDDLKSLDEGDLTLLIQTAEDQIDAYVGPQQHHYYDTNVTRVFPRDIDYERTNFAEYPLTPVIPYQVGRACLRQVEWLFTQWWPTKDIEEMPSQQDATGVNIASDGSLSETYVQKGLDFSSATLCAQAKSILTHFRSRSGAIRVSNPRGRIPYQVNSSREGLFAPPE